MLSLYKEALYIEKATDASQQRGGIVITLTLCVNDSMRMKFRPGDYTECE